MSESTNERSDFVTEKNYAPALIFYIHTQVPHGVHLAENLSNFVLKLSLLIVPILSHILTNERIA